VRAAIILCENVGKDRNQYDSLAEISKILLCNKIKESDTDEIADREIEIGRGVDESNLLLLTNINQGDTNSETLFR